MTIINPSLTLTFLDQNISPGTQVIGSSDIVKGSITIAKQLLNGLKPSSNQVQIQIKRICSCVENIVKTDCDIKAVFKDGNTVLFTGFVATNFSWTVTEAGERALSIELEDTGSRLLAKNFIESGYHLFNCSADAVIRAVCQACSVTVSQNCIFISSIVVKVIDSSVKCSDILSQMLYELGYVYYFDNLGELNLFEVNCTSTTGIPVFDSSKLYSCSGSALSLAKSIRQYHSSRISFTELSSASDFLVYRNTTGSDDSHQYCNMELLPGYYFDGLEIYTPSQWQEETQSQLRKPTLIEACNASSEMEIVGSKKIVSVSDIEVEFESTGSLDYSVSCSGGPYLQITVHNTGITSAFITRLDVYASVLYEKNTSVIRTNSDDLSSSNSDSLFEEEVSYIHDKTLVSKHANLVSQFHRFCNSKYTFYSKEEIQMGTIIKICEDTFSGLNVNVLVYAKQQSDKSEIVKYTAFGISVFDLNKDVIRQKTSEGISDTKGPQGVPGQSYTTEIISSNGSIFRVPNINTTLSCIVLKNTHDITQELSDSAFTWKRKSSDPIDDERWNTSSKAIGHKSVQITNQDCIGRTVFFCEVTI